MKEKHLLLLSVPDPQVDQEQQSAEIVPGDIHSAVAQFFRDLQADLSVNLFDLVPAQAGGIKRILRPLPYTQTHHSRTLETLAGLLLPEALETPVGVIVTLAVEVKLGMADRFPDLIERRISKVLPFRERVLGRDQGPPALAFGKLPGLP